jgi:hypothetical protein
MDDRDRSATARLKRFGNRFGSDGDADSSDKPAWKRYGAWFQVLVVVATAFGGALVSVGSTAIDRASGFVRASGPELFDAFLPILAGVTLVAVAVCLGVVVLGMRNV